MPAKSIKETICAIATPPGSGALGVVRISGPLAREILARLWRGPVPVEKFRPRTLYLGNISVFPNPEGRPLDRVLAVFMPAPATYTGEDVVELSAHGSPFVLREILSACVNSGARPAEPGEFTRRAFMAGKLDLAQAEGVADLIAATSERGARLAASQMEGSLSKRVTSIGEEIASIRAEIEAAIDFPEEDVDAGGGGPLAWRIANALSGVGALKESFREGKLLCEGVRVAIVGKPNAGKSSVMNCLAGRERAIVHHAPGTTRDVVEERLSVGGVAFNLRDTAGLREGAGEVEEIGITKTLREIEEADLVLAVVDGSLDFDEGCAEMFSKLDAHKTVVVVNKSDLPRACLCEGK
ncbi:MAG TPA: tRNA uridine-5-carboxymethylaminomethyl(34) synthesis GTPase MnmE, partial [bacterium]|nr:tRNA uridine-5-carboxymethylaminomethyl(34) synthesis GTPase MnmE [bacterium]